MNIRVALVETHRLVREALRGLLAAERDLAIVGEAGDGRAALELAARVDPDVLVLDLALPDMNGAEVARRLRNGGSRTRLFALAANGDRRCVQEMLKAGADGYLTKTAAAEELPRAIRALAGGQAFLSPVSSAARISSIWGSGCGAVRAREHRPPPHRARESRGRTGARSASASQRT